MEKTQPLLQVSKCTDVKSHTYEKYPIIKADGQCVKAIWNKWEIGFPINIEEVVSLIRNTWPVEPGWHIEVKEDAYEFKDTEMFRNVMFYLLARLEGVSKTEAKLLVEFFENEAWCIVESLYDRLWRCHLGYNCEKLIRAYAKIVKGFVDILPEEERKRGRK